MNYPKMGKLEEKSKPLPDDFESHITGTMSPNSEQNTSKPPENPRPPINWVITTFLVGVPLAATVALLWVPIQRQTLAFACFYAPFRALTVTSGYHRLWSHRSYTASAPLRLFLAIVAAGAGQGGIKFWCRSHRAHHRYVDTEKDPYNIKKGFFWAHLGWMLVVQRGRHPEVDISDLKADPIVEWQHRNYPLLLVLMAYALPTAVCGFSHGDFIGGFVVAGCLSTAAGQQGTFCVNSVAHWIGDRPYTTAKSARDSMLTGLLTLGEGYHNFHHEFPIDYRNGVRLYDLDITKWFIWTLSQIGLASDLKRFPQNEIEKGRLQRRQEKLDQEGQLLNWGPPLAELPVMTWEEYRQQARTGCNLMVIRGIVHEVSEFVTQHPGGAAMITGAIGKDATKLFEGGVYNHSGAASNLLDTMRIAVIQDSVDDFT